MQNLYRRISLSIVLFFIMLSALIFFVVYRPISDELRMDVINSFEHIANDKHRILHADFETVKYHVAHLSSRSIIRDSLAQYLDGEITFEQMQEFTIPKYTDATNTFDTGRTVARFSVDQRLVHLIGTDTDIENYLEWQVKDLRIAYIKEKELLVAQSPIFKGNDVIGYDIILSDISPVIKELEEGIYDISILSENPSQNSIEIKDGIIIAYIDCEVIGTTFKVSTAETLVFAPYYNLTRKVSLTYIAILIASLVIIEIFLIRYVNKYTNVQFKLKNKALKSQNEKQMLIDKMSMGFMLLEIDSKKDPNTRSLKIIESNNSLQNMVEEHTTNLQDGILSEVLGNNGDEIFEDIMLVAENAI